MWASPSSSARAPERQLSRAIDNRVGSATIRGYGRSVDPGGVRRPRTEYLPKGHRHGHFFHSHDHGSACHSRRRPRQHAAQSERCARPFLYPEHPDPDRQRGSLRCGRSSGRRKNPPDLGGCRSADRRAAARIAAAAVAAHAEEVRRPRCRRARAADLRPAHHDPCGDGRRIGAARPARPAPRSAGRRAAWRRPATRRGRNARLSLLHRRPRTGPIYPMRAKQAPTTPGFACATKRP